MQSLVFSQVRKKRRRIQNFYRLFLVLYFVFGTIAAKTFPESLFVFVPVSAFLLLYEIYSGDFGRRNFFGGRLRLDDDAPESAEQRHPAHPPAVSHGSAQFAYKNQLPPYLILFAALMLPMAGLIKQLLLWEKNLTLLNLLPFVALACFALVIKEHLTRCILLDSYGVHVKSMFRKVSIPYSDIKDVRLVDLLSYVRRYSTYVEIRTEKSVCRIPIDEVEDYPALRTGIEIRVGYAVRY
jgi:hypothetical protein